MTLAVPEERLAGRAGAARAETAYLDGNEAVARVAHALSEAIAIYPITPATPMGEHADAWSATGRRNLWGAVPEVVEMQSEGGAAGTLHGLLQSGTLATPSRPRRACSSCCRTCSRSPGS